MKVIDGGCTRWRQGLVLGAALLLPGGGAMAADAPDMALRMQACSACHGKEGRATPDGFFPRIAGKPASYLFHQLQNFRDGRRNNGAMASLVEQMPDEYLREIAAYYAALELPYAPAPAPQAAPAVLARGAALAREGDRTLKVPACVACHGQRLTGTLPAIPGLLGLPRGYLVSQLGAWQASSRAAHAPDCMADIANRLTPSDVAAVSAWLAAQPLPADTHPAVAAAAPLPLECGSVKP